MPWPFRRHRSHDAGAPSRRRAAGRPSRSMTSQVRRRLVAHAGGWQTLEPLRPSATGAAAPVVSSGASFISQLAGTQPLLPTASLREVSSDAPRGMTHGLARPLPAAAFASVTAGFGRCRAGDRGAVRDAHEATRRPVVASGSARSSRPHDATQATWSRPSREPAPTCSSSPTSSTTRSPRSYRRRSSARCSPSGRGASWPSFVPTSPGESEGGDADDVEVRHRSEAVAGGVATARSRCALALRTVRRGEPRERRTRDDRGRGAGSGIRAARATASTRRTRRGRRSGAGPAGRRPLPARRRSVRGAHRCDTRARSRSWRGRRPP